MHSTRRRLTFLVLVVSVVLCACGDKVKKQAPTANPSATPRIPDKLSLRPPAPPAIKPRSEAVNEVGPGGGTVEHAGARIVVPPAALTTVARIAVQRVGDDSLPGLPPGLINVTDGGGGYRLLPEGQRFAKKVSIALPLKKPGKAASAQYWIALGARTFFWDAIGRRWTPLDGAALGAGEAVTSDTDHFTLMINAIVKAPEHAGPANFNENAISSIGAGDPTTNVDLVQPPDANNQGDAQVTFPFRLPKGRGAFSPQLSLSYSSSSGSGPFGVGWDLPISKVTVDTRLGVPVYDGSERYLLDGVPLIRVSGSGSSCRRANTTTIAAFAARVHRQQRIVMCRGASGRYWEITQRDGVRFDYGVDAAHRLEPAGGDEARSASWMLQEVEDTNSNVTTYTYARLGEDTATQVAGHLYLSQLSYTSHRTEPLAAAYQVELAWDDCDAEHDTISSARNGFLTETSCRLKEITVKALNAAAAYATVRGYVFEYAPSSFDGKELLKAIKVTGREGGDFYVHSFQYADPELGPMTGSPTAFGAAVNWVPDSASEPGPLSDKAWLLDFTDEENYQANFSGGLSVKWGAGDGANAGCTVGGSTGISLECPTPELRMADINGDGVADRIWTGSSGDLRVALSQTDPAAQRPHVSGISLLESQVALGGSQGFDTSCNAGVASVTTSANLSLRISASDTQLLDVDGDGRVDLLSGGSYYKGVANSCRDGLPPSRCADGGSPDAAGRCASRATFGLCSDGLRVCRDPSAICFDAARNLDGLRPSPPEPTVLASKSPPAVRDPIAQPSRVPPRPPRRARATGSVNHAVAVVASQTEGRSTAAAARNGRSSTALPGSTGTSSTRPEVSESTGRPGVDARRARPRAERSLAPEDGWGPYTSARRRMAKDNTADHVAAPFESMRPVIRWDAPLKGQVRLNIKARRLHSGGKDGVLVSLLKVTDFHTAAGTQVLAQVTLSPDAASWAALANEHDIALEFGESILVVYDTLEDSPVTETGVLLDEVRSEIGIKYQEVCPLGDSCRVLRDEELAHKNASGELAYVFRYPDDLRASELPRELYWQMLPPLGPPVKHPTLDRTISSQVGLEIKKTATTPGRVHVRVRCESIGSEQANDTHVCPLGRILRDVSFQPDEITETRTAVPVPSPFVRSDALIPSHPDCVSYNRNNLTVHDRGELGWRLEDGDHWMALYASEADANRAADIAKKYQRLCFFGRAESAQASDYVHDYFALSVPDEAPGGTAPDEDCVSYQPGSLQVEELSGDAWVLRAGDMRMMVLNSREDAESARSVAQYYTRQCFIGRGNVREGTEVGQRPSDFVSAYFGGPIERVMDPTRLLVEVDGENGVEVPPEAVAVKASLVVHALRDVGSVEVGRTTVAGESQTVNLVTALPDVHSFAQEERPRIPLRTLHRVHPARNLRAFRTQFPHERILIRASVVRPRHPLFLSITGDSFEGALWQETLRDLPAGQVAATKEFEVNVAKPGLYYLRGYTEASFDPEASTSVEAWITKASRKDWIDVPVNLLRADFGSTYYADWAFPRVVGEVAHSFDPYAGGHHGFFYGLFKGHELKCLGPYACETHPPAPLHVDAHASTAPTRSKAPLKTGTAATPRERLMRPALRKMMMAERKASPPGSSGSPPQEDARSASSGIPGCDGTREYCCVKQQPQGDCDGDGITNESDACVLAPETFNNVEDADGCPDLCLQDSDEDGVADCADACPYEPKDFQGIPGQTNGCPGALPGASQPSDPLTPDSGGDTGCYVGAGYAAWVCGANGGRSGGGGGGSIHPPITNSNSGAGRDKGGSISQGGCDPLELDGFRRTWVFGLSVSQGAAVTLGNSTIGLGGNYTVGIGAQYTDRDVLDWNGDGIIDFTSPNVITLGARDGVIRLNTDCYLLLGGACLLNPGVRETASASLGFSLGGSGSGKKQIRTTPEGEIKDQGPEKVTFGLGAHLSYAATLSQRLDLNGDGLPDQVIGRPDRNVDVRTNAGRALTANASRPVQDSTDGTSEVELMSGGSTFVSEVGDYLLGRLGRKPISTSNSFTRSDSIGGGGGIQLGVVGVSGSGSRSDNRTLTQNARDFVDVNGDGLVDLVTKAANQSMLHVAFNMGRYFAKPKTFKIGTWPGIDGTFYTSGLDNAFAGVVFGKTDPLGASGSQTTTWAGSAEATVFFVTGSTSFAYTEGGSTAQLMLRDVDSDGIPDRVLRTGGESPATAIRVARGLFGRANLLTRIDTPVGGVIKLDYSRAMPTEDAPRAKWNLSKVTLEQSSAVLSAVCGDDSATTCGLPPVETAFEYAEGYHDRYEKENLGYRFVRATRAADGRVAEREYANRDYWLRGSLVTERVRAGSGALLTETVSTYDSSPLSDSSTASRDLCLSQLIIPQRFLNTAELRADKRTPCDVRAPRTVRTERRSYEESSAPLVFAQDVALDDNGNPKTITEQVGGANQPVVFTLIDYDARPAFSSKHILDRARSIIVRSDGATGALLRRREARYDDRGNLERHEVWDRNTSTHAATLDLTPDAFGFVTAVTDANGYKIFSEPDSISHQFSVRTYDNVGCADLDASAQPGTTCGLASTAAYDFGLQQVTASTDPNGNVIERRYDQFGRLEAVRGPYERAAGQDSLSIVYDPLASGTFPKKALTTNRTVHPDTGAVHTTLKVARFVDGLGREIQSQTETDIAVQGSDGLSAKHGRAVSGRIAFDAAGRAEMIGQPTFAEGVSFAFEKIDWDRTNCTTTGPVYCTRNEYDALDRATKTTAPGGIPTTNTRRSTSHPRVAARWVRQTEIVDAMGKIRRLFHDASDRLVGVVEVLSGQELKTTYDYSAVGDLTAIEDARENVRTFEYDLAGRRTAIVTPDTGRREIAYDPMGNVQAQIDSEMCSTTAPLLSNPECATKSIQRHYVKNRLIFIDYPSVTGTQDVAFTYGDDDPTNLCSETVGGVARPLSNTKGRACWRKDLAGSEKRSFGAIGEMQLQERTLPLFEGSGLSRTYVTKFLHDSFGRLLWLEYPDGEKLTYGYDDGWRVTSVAGVRGSVSANYVLKRLYDVHGKPIATMFANGVTEQNEYEPDTQRLKRRTQYRGSTLVLDLQIGEYDKASNIKSSVTQRNEGHEITRIERTYSYDDLHRLDTFTVDGKRADGASGLTLNGNYDFDDVGNIAHQSMAGTGLVVSNARDWTYAYPAGATRPNSPETIGPQRFTYNDRGALKTITSDATQSSLEWNDEGQLAGVAVTGNSGSRYLYGADGVRAWQQVKNAASADVLHYPSPYYTANYYRTKPEGCADDSCATTIPNRTKHVRIDGTTVVSVVALLASHTEGPEHDVSYMSTAPSFLHADQVRSTIAVTGVGGNPERVYEYLPFGEYMSAASSPAGLGEISFASFNGMERDEATTFDYFGARHYSSVLGRWLSPDPLSLEGIPAVQPKTLSLFSFAHNSPTGYFDPDGMAPTNTASTAMSHMRANDDVYYFHNERAKFHNHPGEQAYFDSLPKEYFSYFGGQWIKKPFGTTNCSTAVLEALWLTFVGREKELGLNTKGFGSAFQGVDDANWVDAIETANMGSRANPQEVQEGDIASNGSHRFFVAESPQFRVPYRGTWVRILEANVAQGGADWRTTRAVREDRWIPLSDIKEAARLRNFD